MTKLILLTDTHITKPDQHIIGLDPEARLQKVLDHATHHHPDAQGIVVMGDLVHFGSRDEYTRFQDVIAASPLPVTLMLGNHDRRAGFMAVFGKEGFQQHSFEFGHHHVLCLDTLDEDAPDTHSGVLCEARLDWLRGELERAKRPVIVLMHHHIADTGFNGMDAIKLRNAAQVTDILTQSGKVAMVINGHIHRTIFTSHHGLPIAMLKSTCHQMPLILGAGSSGLSVDEPGAYGVLISNSNQVLLHTEDVFDTPPEQIEDERSQTP